MIIISVSLCLTGCIVINTGEGTEKSKEESSQSTKTKEVTIKSNSNSNNSSSDNSVSNVNGYDGYIFADSNCRYLTKSDLVNLNKWELKIARNEIYARHGRLFKDSSIQNYFNSCYWYDGYISPESFNNNTLNDYETYNIKLIKSYE